MNYYTKSFGKEKEEITFTYMDEPIEHGLIGIASSAIFEENVAVVIDEKSGNDEFDFACLACGENGIAPRIIITREFYDEIKRDTYQSKTVLLHEIGHYINGDIGKGKGSCYEERINLVKQNKVSRKELKADEFAVHYLGKDIVVEGLSSLKQWILSKYADYDEASVQITIKEIDIRISTIEGANE